MGTWPDAVRLAVGTLTRWPVRPPTTVDRPRAARAMLLAPLVGLALGAATSAFAWLGAAIGLTPLVLASLVVAGWALASRGLHLDGLADTADALASGRPAAAALDVMRRSDVGPVGAACVVLVLMIQVAALAEALADWGPSVCLVAAAASRLALPLACRRGVPAARSDGLGAAVAASVPVPAAIAAVVLTAAVTGTVVSVVGGGRGLALSSAVSAGAAVIAACAATFAGLAIAVRRFGGVSGDVLGWVVELSLVAALLALAAS